MPPERYGTIVDSSIALVTTRASRRDSLILIR